MAAEAMILRDQGPFGFSHFYASKKVGNLSHSRSTCETPVKKHTCLVQGKTIAYQENLCWLNLDLSTVRSEQAFSLECHQGQSFMILFQRLFVFHFLVKAFAQGAAHIGLPVQPPGTGRILTSLSFRDDHLQPVETFPCRL